MKRNTITGLVGMIGSLLFFILIHFQTKVPANLLEPGPRLLPYVSFFIVALSSLMLFINGLREGKKNPGPDKPYFPKGGILKVTKSFLMLVLTAICMNFFGFLITAPFAVFAFIFDLKGNSKVKPLFAAIVALVVTAGLYLMFVVGFQVSLPAGILFE
ncbi:MAG: tripartite tricarboxylate transporter TctB family protein [Blautia sp.]|nr:tripartite tricarboxylate transporter TctB family protein [Blautia sp.]